MKKIMEFVTEKAAYTADTIIRESTGRHVKKPDAEFMCGEGDDRAKAYKWKFIQLFQCKDKRGKHAREVLGVVTAILYVSAGMCLEPQDRTGRVSPEKLIDATNRIEFTSRISVPVANGTLMFSFPKLRKTFAAATVTFNVTDSFNEAAATKMLSIMSMCDQCPFQLAFYSMVCRYYLARITNDRIIMEKRKYEWWEFKLILLIKDNNLEATLSNIYRHLHERAEKKMRLSPREVNDFIDAFNGADGDDLRSVEELVQRYAAALPRSV